MLELNPNFFPARFHLGKILLQKGMFEEAIAEFVKGHELAKGNPVSIAGLARAYARAGRKDEALKLAGELKALKQNQAMPYEVAIIYLSLGDKEQALAWLEKAYAERDVNITYLKVDPALDDLRTEARFLALVQRVGLAQQ